ncbi:MAG: PIN domain-containing protein [Parvularculaceae bacterium]
MKWIADTNVISETVRPSPEPRVMAWLEATPIERLHTTSVNLAEIRFGVLSQGEPARANALENWLERTVRPLFEGRILQADEDALLTWRTLSKELQRRREPTPSADLLIAAIALIQHCAVASRDARPFAAAGVPTLNPWTGERFNLEGRQ